MPLLYLIRHGKAAFGSQDYDQLSDIGHRQARIAGEHLNRIGVRFDAVYRGRLHRQKATLQALSEGYSSDTASPSLPLEATEAAFDEYDADRLFEAYLPSVLERNAELTRAREQIKTDRVLFQRAFSGVMDAWLRGQPHGQANLESWENFLERVDSGLQRIVFEQERTAKVAVITSGGPIAAAMRSALQLGDKQAIRINYGIFNASITRLRAGRSARRLVGFNDIAHLELKKDPELISFR